MQKVRIPTTVDPVKSAGKQLVYDGLVPSSALSRLQALLLTPSADVPCVISFGTDEQGIHYVQGEAATEVEVACERCNEAMSLSLSTTFQYAPVTRRQPAEDMPSQYELVELDEFGEINLHRIVEDELMLAMPVVVKHDDKDCSIDSSAMSWGKIDDSPEPSENPFAVLQALKRK